MKIPDDCLKGKTALVTGAGSGIGRATAKLLSHAGAKVALIGRTEDELFKVWQEMGAEGAGHLKFVADVTDEGALERAFSEISRQWDGLQIVVANAGINGTWAPLADIKLSEWNETVETNLTGTFLTVRGAYPLLKKTGGSIVIVSSVNGNRIFSNCGATAYSCSKAGQSAFAKMTALEFAKDRIRVNVICPGSIETEIDDSTDKRNLEAFCQEAEYPHGEIPLTGGCPGTAGQVAQLIWFLGSDASNHISGSEIYIDGAQSVLKG
jgi:NAD(P)-dependent dehydrogenase (short-subunit alcohol dehydrogenase family)